MLFQQVSTSEVLGIISLSTAVSLAAIKTVNYVISRMAPPSSRPTVNSDRISVIERSLVDQQRILIDHQRENRQTFKEMRDGINKLVTLAEQRKN